jgi:carbonic anhydrase
VGGRRYAVYIGRRVSLAHQAQVHGPAAVGDNTFVGMQALVFRAEVGDNCVLEPRALVMGVRIQAGRYVPAGAVVRTQAAADALPRIDESYPFAHLNEGVLHVNHELAEGYEHAFPGRADQAP